MKKNKTLSADLTKTYYILLFVFFLIYSSLIAFVIRYQYKYARIEIYNVERFLKHELLEPEHQNLDYFFYQTLRESPEIEGLYIIINYENKTYSDSNSPILGELLFKDKIQNFYNLSNLKKSYWVLNKRFDTLNHGTLDIRIIKKLESMYTFFEKIFIFSIFGLFILLILFYLITKKFYNKLIPQLATIEYNTNLIDINNFDYSINKDDFYSEFSNILISYEEMIKRLKNQTDLQLDFVRNASHELKTPIFILKGYSNIIEKYGDTDKDLLNESNIAIKEEIKYIELLTEKLLFLSRKENIKLEISEFNLNDLLLEILYDMKIIHEVQKINYLPKNIFINNDYFLMKQVLRNLIDNAIKYGENNLIEIFTYENNKIFSIAIKDRGIGIPKIELENIFLKFYRINKSHSREIQGHGLGLSIVKTILALLGGEIYIESELGKGTEVKIIFNKS